MEMLSNRFPSPSCQSPHEYDGEDFFPPLCWERAHRHNGEGFPLLLHQKTHTDATERFPSLSGQSPPKYDGPPPPCQKKNTSQRGKPLSIASKTTQMRRAHRGGEISSFLRPVFLCWNK